MSSSWWLLSSHSHFCQGDVYQFCNWQVAIIDALMVSKYAENCFIWLFFLVQPHSSVNRVIEVMNVSLGLGSVKSSLGNILIMCCRQIARLYLSHNSYKYSAHANKHTFVCHQMKRLGKKKCCAFCQHFLIHPAWYPSLRRPPGQGGASMKKRSGAFHLWKGKKKVFFHL